VHLRGAGLRRAHERGAELGGGRAGRQHGGDGAPGGQAAGGDQRQVDRRGDELQRREHAEVGGRVVVVEHGAVPARLDALDDERVGAGVARDPRLGRARDRHPRLGARRVHALEHGGLRAAERERHDRDALGLGERELVLPAVVVVPRLAERDARQFALVAQPAGVGAHRVVVGRAGGRREDVEPERPCCEPAQRLEVGAHRVGRLVAGGEEAEPARLAHRRRQRRRRRAAGERRLHDRELQPFEHRHSPIMSTQGSIVPAAAAPRPIDPGVSIGHVHLRTADAGAR
jgi:hypothetical protein